MPAVLDLLYTDCEPILDKACKSFVQLHGGDYEDIRANANTLFLEAWSTFDYRGRFEGFLNWFVTTRLLNLRKKETRLVKRERSAAAERREDYEPSGFILEDFISNLNPDAARMVSTAIAGADLNKGAARNKGNKGGRHAHMNKGNRGRPVSRLTSIRNYFKDVGWAASRITSAITEIREALG